MSSSTVGVGVDDLVTGEAVALELPPAGIAMHALSGFLDVAITLLTLMVGLFIVGLTTQGADAAIASVAVTVLLVLVFVVLPTSLETLTRGRSVGKFATGLRTVRDDAGPIGFRQALTRALVGFVEIWMLFGVPALISGLVSSKGKRLGDHAAGTYVVRERVHLILPPPPMMPPHLASWAAGADIARLPDGTAMAVRQFLMRASVLSPQSRATLGVQLRDEVVSYVAPQPPADTHPELVLAAVIADRRRRDAIRLQRDAALRSRLIPADPIDKLHP
ncbi:MAG TPA: RDD family protein [Dermatophilaceae bacterium]|nr:RDD family protein [Dermatophilaceae bacterium]